MDIFSDNALMLQVKAGDPERMGLLFERYHRPLYGFFFHMIGQQHASEDLVQNVFFRMLKYSRSFTGKGEFKTWMYHLARNVLKDHLKKDRRLPVYYDVSEFEESITGEQPSHEPLEKKQEIIALQTAMKNLPDESLELLVLCRYQELKYQEIAQLLNISEGAVKVRVHRAMKELKDLYLKNAHK